MYVCMYVCMYVYIYIYTAKLEVPTIFKAPVKSILKGRSPQTMASCDSVPPFLDPESHIEIMVHQLERTGKSPFSLVNPTTKGPLFIGILT